MVTDAAELAREARQVRLGRFALLVFLGTFWSLGWLGGHLWVGLVMAALATRRGWRDSTGWTPPPQQPQPPAGQVR